MQISGYLLEICESHAHSGEARVQNITDRKGREMILLAGPTEDPHYKANCNETKQSAFVKWFPSPLSSGLGRAAELLTALGRVLVGTSNDDRDHRDKKMHKNG